MLLVVLDWAVLSPRIDALLDLLELFGSPPGIILLSTRGVDRAALTSIGVVAFACKEEPPERLLAAIRKAGEALDTFSEAGHDRQCGARPINVRQKEKRT